MNIQYYGHSCFKLTTKSHGRNTDSVTIFFDPFHKSTGLKPPQGKTDIVFISHMHHDDHNNIDTLRGNPIVINTPGEFSVKGISVTGMDSFHDEKEGIDRGRNTIFVLETENIKLCHLGDLGTDLTVKQLEKIGAIDILFIPVGGKYTIDGKMSAKLVQKLEPKIIIPMHYKVPRLKIEGLSDEKDFCGEIGNCPKEKVNKITIKEKDLLNKNREVILMKS